MSKASKEGSFLLDEVINTKEKVIPIDENSSSSHDDDAATALPKIYTPKITAINLVDPSRLFSTPPPPSASFLDEHDASTLVLTGDDDEESVNIPISSVTRSTSINETKQNVGSVVGTSSSSSSSSLKPLVAGPQQKQHSQRGARKCFKDEDHGEISPQFAEIHQELRKLLGIYGCGISQQQQLLKTIKLYINLCRNEFDEVIASAQKCRRLVRSMSRMMDLLHQISLSFEDTFEFVHRMIELVAIYVSCELRYAKEFKEHKPLIANRILQNIYIYLKGPKKDETTSYILRMFAHMSSMYREREVMTKIFQTIIPKEQVILQRELPDNVYIQYIIVFYHWQQLELVHEDKMGVIEFANKFMRPAKTLCTNATYAYHLPKYNSLGTATQYILSNLKFFHDLRNASIYDNRLKTDTGTIDISEGNPQSFSKATVNINFAELVQNTNTCPAVRPMIKLEDQVVIATIDLTIDNSHENDLQWMQDLQRNATKMEPARNALAILATRYRAALTEDEVIEIESDTDEETNVVSLEEEPLSLEEPEHLDFDETEYMDAEGNELNDIGRLANESVEKAYRTDNNFTNGQTTAATAIKTSIGEHSSTSLPQQIISTSPKLNIISVRSIAPTQSNKITHCERASSTESTDHDPTPSSSQLDPIKYSNDITKAYSNSTTQTEFRNFQHLTVTDSTTPQSCSIQDLPDKPNIIEVRSIGTIQSPFRNNARSGAGRPFITNQYDLKQLNPQIRVFSSTERTPINTSVSLSDEKYMCRRNSLHINSSPVGTTQIANRDIAAEAKNNMAGDQERNDLHAFSRSVSNIATKTFSFASTDTKYRNHDVDDDDDELYTIGASSKITTKKNSGDDGFNSSKVIYSVNKMQIHHERNELTSEDDVPNYIKNPFKSNKKKLVQFSNRPVEHKRNTGIQYPIKPAIKNTANSSFNTQHTTFNSCFGSASPASTTSSTYTKSQPNRKGMKENSNFNSIQEETKLEDNVCIELSTDNLKLNSHLIISTQPTILKKFNNLSVFDTNNETTVKANVIADSSIENTISNNNSSNNNNIQNMTTIQAVDISSTNEICDEKKNVNLVNNCELNCDEKRNLNVTASTATANNEQPQQQYHDDDSDTKKTEFELVTTTAFVTADQLKNVVDKDEVGFKRNSIITRSKDSERFKDCSGTVTVEVSTTAQLKRDDNTDQIKDDDLHTDMEEEINVDATEFKDNADVLKDGGEELQVDAEESKELRDDDGEKVFNIDAGEFKVNTEGSKDNAELIHNDEEELKVDDEESNEVLKDDGAEELNTDAKGYKSNTEVIHDDGEELKVNAEESTEIIKDYGEEELNNDAEGFKSNIELIHGDGEELKVDVRECKELIKDDEKEELKVSSVELKELIETDGKDEFKDDTKLLIHKNETDNLLQDYDQVKGRRTMKDKIEFRIMDSMLKETSSTDDEDSKDSEESSLKIFTKDGYDQEETLVENTTETITTTADTKLLQNIVAVDCENKEIEGRDSENTTNRSTASSINWQEEEKNSYYVLEEFLILHKRRISQDTKIGNLDNTSLNARASNNTNDKSNNGSTSLSTSSTTTCINNNSNNSNIQNDVELDSDLEFDFDFVFGLDFDTMTPTAPTTTITSISKVPADDCNVEADKLLEQFNVASEHIVETVRQKGTEDMLPKSTSSSSTEELLQETTLSTNLSSSISSSESTRSLSCPKIACVGEITTSTVVFVSNTLEITSFSSPTSSSSHHDARVVNEANREPVHAGNNVGLPLELGNDLLINADDDLLPSSELITDSELLKEFVTIPTKSPKHDPIEVEELRKCNDSSMSITSDVTDAADLLKEFKTFPNLHKKLTKQNSEGEERNLKQNANTTLPSDVESREIAAVDASLKTAQSVTVSEGVAEEGAIRDSHFEEYGDEEDSISRRLLLDNIISVDHNSSNFADQQVEIALPLKKRRKISEYQDELDLNSNAVLTFTEEDEEEEMNGDTKMNQLCHTLDYAANRNNTNSNTDVACGSHVLYESHSLFYVEKPREGEQTADSEEMLNTITEQILITNAAASPKHYEVNAMLSSSSLNLQQQMLAQPKPILLPTNSSPPQNKQVQIVTPQIKELCKPFEITTTTNSNSNGNSNSSNSVHVFTTPMPESYPAEPMISIANLENLNLTNHLQRYLDALVSSIHITKTIDAALAVTRFFQGFPDNSGHNKSIVFNDKLSVATKLLQESRNTAPDEGKLLLKIYPDDSISILVENNSNDSEWIKLPTATAAVLTKAAKSLEYWEKSSKKKQQEEQDQQLHQLQHQHGQKLCCDDQQPMEVDFSSELSKMNFNTFNDSNMLTAHDFKNKPTQQRNVQLPKKDRMLLELQFAEERLGEQAQIPQQQNIAKNIATSGVVSFKNIQTVAVAPLEQQKNEIFDEAFQTAAASINAPTSTSPAHQVNTNIPATADAVSVTNLSAAHKFVDKHLANMRAKEQIFSSVIQKSNSSQMQEKITCSQKLANDLQDFGLHYYGSSNKSIPENTGDYLTSSYNELHPIESIAGNYSRSKNTSSHLLQSSAANLCAPESLKYMRQKYSKNKSAETGAPSFGLGVGSRHTLLQQKQDVVNHHYDNSNCIPNINVDNRQQLHLDAKNCYSELYQPSFMQSSSFVNMEQQNRFPAVLLPSVVTTEPAVEAENIDISQLKLPYTKTTDYQTFYNTRGIKRRQHQQEKHKLQQCEEKEIQHDCEKGSLPNFSAERSENDSEISKQQSQQRRFVQHRHHHHHHHNQQQQQQQLYENLHNKATSEYETLRKKKVEYEWQQHKQQQYQKQLQELVERQKQVTAAAASVANQLNSSTLLTGAATLTSSAAALTTSTTATASPSPAPAELSQTFPRFANNLNLLASVSQSAEVLVQSAAIHNTNMATADVSAKAELRVKAPKRGPGRPRKNQNNTQPTNSKEVQIQNQNTTQSTNSKQIGNQNNKKSTKSKQVPRARRNKRVHNTIEEPVTAAVRPSSAATITAGAGKTSSSFINNNSSINLSNLLMYPHSSSTSNNRNASTMSCSPSSSSSTSTTIFNPYLYLPAPPMTSLTSNTSSSSLSSSSSPVPSKRVCIENISLPNI